MADFQKKLQNKVAVVTGASSGIGAATAVELAKLGCSLILVGRQENKLEDTLQKCLATGLEKEKMTLIIADLSTESGAKNVIDRTIQHFGKLDILINSAGILYTGSIETMTMSQYDELMNINLRSIIVLTQEAVPHLINSKGNIVNVSSVTGLRAFPNVLSYCISKAALDQFTRCVSLELAAKGVRVNAVNPGVIITNIHKQGGMDEEQYAQFLQHSKTTHAMGRVGTAEEVAKTIAFLASEDASFITGQTLAIDGGRSVMCPR